MNKIVNFILIYASLFLIEIIISFLMLILIDTFEFGFDFFYLKKAFNGSVLWNYWRLLFHGLPLIILFFLLFRYISLLKIDYKPIVFSFFNLMIYVLLSYLSEIIFGNNVPLQAEGFIFKVTCIAIFTAPLILGLTPYFKAKLESLAARK